MSTRFQSHLKFNNYLTLILLLIVFAIFFIGLIFPLGLATNIAYIFVVLLCYYKVKKQSTYIFSALCICLVVVGYFFSPPGESPQQAIIINRLIIIGCIILAAMIIIDFKNNTARLRNEDALLKSILTSTIESVIAVNEAGEIVYKNASAVNAFGINDNLRETLNINELIPYGFTDRRTVKLGADIIARQRNGTEFPVDISIGRFNTDDGIYITYFIMDISVRKKAETEVIRKDEALEKSEKFLQSIIQNMPLYIQVRETPGMEVLIENKPKPGIFGQIEAKIAGNKLDEQIYNCISQEQLAELQNAEKETLLDGKITIVPELHVHLPSGEERFIKITKIAVSTSAHDINYLINLCEDLTENIIAQKELKKMNQLLLETQEIGNVGSFESNLQKTQSIYSRELINILGVDERDHYAFDFLTEFIHPEEKEKIVNDRRCAVSENIIYTENFRIIRPDGEIRHVLLKSRTINDETGKPLRRIGLLLDITELKETEENLKIYIKGLEDIIFMTSHKLRVPITNITGMANILEQSLNSPEKLQKLVQYINKSALILDDFTREMAVYMDELNEKQNNW